MQNFSHGHAIALPPTAPGSPVPSWAQVTGSVYFVQFSTFLPSPKTQECQPLGLKCIAFYFIFFNRCMVQMLQLNNQTLASNVFSL